MSEPRADGESSKWLRAVLAERYELVEVLGSGHTTTVFRGLDRELERDVAVKVLQPRLAADPRWIDWFRREARAAAGLRHENIVTVLAQGDHEGAPYVVLEHIDGMTLRQLLQRAGRLPTDRALEVAIGIADGAAYVHRNSSARPSLKPEKVLLTPEGTPKLAGLSTDRPPAPGTSSERSGKGGAGELPGSDQAASESGRDDGEDVYALAAVLHELLTGDSPASAPGEGESEAPTATEHTPVSMRLEQAIAVASGPQSDNRPKLEVFAQELRSWRSELVEAPLLRLGVPSLPRPRGRPGSTTIAAPLARKPVPASPVSRRRSDPIRPLGDRHANPALLLLPLLILGVAAAALAITHPWRASRHPVVAVRTAKPVRPSRHIKRSPPKPLPHLRELAAYDPPPGDGVEQNAELPNATDGQAGTAWSTEWYQTASFSGIKPGVGIVLDAGVSTRVPALTIQSDTPGFTVVVKTGATATGPFRPASRQYTIGTRTTVVLRVPRPRRYYLIWITSLPAGTAPHYHADINEARATRPPAASHA